MALIYLIIDFEFKGIVHPQVILSVHDILLSDEYNQSYF